MGVFKRIYKNVNDFLYEHRILRTIVEYIISLFASVLSAFFYAYGFRTFLDPMFVESASPIIAGGASGLSQVLVAVISNVFNVAMDVETSAAWLSIIYFVINIPLLILAITKVGKKFAIFSFVNVFLVSFLTSLIDESWIIFKINETDYLSRALFAGVFTGIATTIAVKFDHSTGGIEIISVYLSSRSKGSMGKYMLIINGVIIVAYTLLKGVDVYGPVALYSIVYLFTSSTVIDTFNLRHKKVQLQVITSNESLSKILISNLPHGCTIVDAKGAFKNSDKKILYMDISTSEIKLAVKVIKEVDEEAFISISPIQNIYGKFYIKPLK